MRTYLILPLLLTASLLHAFSLRDQGYFDIGVGPEVFEKTTINAIKTEYYPGPLIQTSVGLAYKNGLGLSFLYQFSYNKVKNDLSNANDAPEFTNYIAMLNFIYKLLPSSEVAVFFQGGPGLVVNTDQKLSSTTSSQPDATATATTTNADGETTGVTTTVTEENVQAADPFDYHENFAFGYQMGGGIEYRQDNHKAFVLQVNYLKSHIFQSEYDETDNTKATTSMNDDLEGFSGSFSMRYYL